MGTVFKKSKVEPVIVAHQFYACADKMLRSLHFSYEMSGSENLSA